MLAPPAPTIIPAQPGYELLSLDDAGKVVSAPIVAWAIALAGIYFHEHGGISPIAIGGCTCGECVTAIKLPDGRVSTLDDHPRFYRDAVAWRASIIAPEVADAWADAGHQTIGKA